MVYKFTITTEDIEAEKCVVLRISDGIGHNLVKYFNIFHYKKVFLKLKEGKSCIFDISDTMTFANNTLTISMEYAYNYGSTTINTYNLSDAEVQQFFAELDKL